MAVPSGYDCPGFFTSPRMAGCVSCGDTVSRFPFRRRAYFVGAAPCFKLELEGKVHYIATGVCGVASSAWICLAGYWLFPLLLSASCIYLTYRYQRPMFWVECSLFLSVYLTVFCLLL